MESPIVIAAPLMSNAKWERIRSAMLNLENPPHWRSKDVDNGFLSDWDGEWYYHFKDCGYETIEWLDIRAPTDEIRGSIRDILANIRVPGRETSVGFRVLGYSVAGEAVEYIQ